MTRSPAPHQPGPNPRGTIHRIHVSNGGVPKLAVASAEAGPEGLAGDWQNDRKHHGGPERGLCLLGLDVIERLADEGHPISPGTTGENLTLAGVHWADLAPGQRLLFEGGVELKITSHAVPCPTIAASFEGGDFSRMSAKLHPNDSRLYARVQRTGPLAAGESFVVVAPD